MPRFWNKRVAWTDPAPKDVKPKDRIKWWNIIPGDEVRVSGDPNHTIHRVRATNKFTNRVYLSEQNV